MELERVRIFDTTLRDGEQSPGCSMSVDEKLLIARTLEAAQVDIIEAGFPISSPGDFEAVSRVAQALKGCAVAGLARCLPEDIDTAVRALERAARPRIHVFCATSRIHREHKLKKTVDQIVNDTGESVARARRYAEDVEFSPEDASRTEPEVLRQVVATAISAGATTINIPDTVGYSEPDEYGGIFADLLAHVAQIRQQGIVLSAHCHNDLGLAVSNSLAAVRNGARQVECTVLGIGERAGNACLAEVVMALKVRQDRYGLTTGFDSTKLYHLSRLVSSITGHIIPRTQPIVGDNAFAHEAGIHQHGVLAKPETYEIMDPRQVGVPDSRMVLGKHSGRRAFKQRLEELGMPLSGDWLERAFRQFKELADCKKGVYDDDLEALVTKLLANGSSNAHGWSLHFCQILSGGGTVPTATICLKGPGGAVVRDAATGNGGIDAAFSAIGRITGLNFDVIDCDSKSLTGGTDAQAEASVVIRFADKLHRGRGISTDTSEATVQALLSALNRAIRLQVAPDLQANAG